MNITITLENPAEIKEDLIELNNDHYSEDHRKGFMSLNIDWDAIDSMYNAGHLLGFIIRDADKVVGYSTVELTHNIQTDSVVAFMNTLYISKSYRSKGIAKSVILKIEDTLKQAEIDYFSIGFRDDDKANKLLDGLGYTKTEVIYAKGLGE